MTEIGGRVPAWRRLGLTLKSEDQSSVTQTNSAVPKGETPHSVLSDLNLDWNGVPPESVGPPVNGKSWKLGKRKHLHDTAEINGDASKRNRTSHSGTIKKKGVGSQQASVAQSHKNTVPTTLTTPKVPGQVDNARSKGDPNYRKKKSKQEGTRVGADESRSINSAGSSSSLRVESSTRSLAEKQDHPTLLASTEVDVSSTPPSRYSKRHSVERSISKGPSGSPSATDYRKSVTFTPDTKTSDGSSAQDLFKKWAAEQKSQDSTKALSEISKGILPCPTQQTEKDQKPAKTSKKDKQSKGQQKSTGAKVLELNSTVTPAHRKSISSEASYTSIPPAVASQTKAKGRKKNNSLYTAYLTHYYIDRAHWKFNKAKQNDVIHNALNIFRIPEEYLEALVEYVSGLKGAAVIARLKDKCTTVLAELDRVDAQDQDMDNPGDRKALQDAVIRERTTKERKRQKVEGDVENIANHPHGDAYIRRLKRIRAEALLTALARTAPVLPATQANGINPTMEILSPSIQRDSKKRKRRGEVSSDESSSESSSSSDSDEEESSSGPESTNDYSESSLASEAASNSNAGSEMSDGDSASN